LEGSVTRTDSGECNIDVKGHEVRVPVLRKKVGERVIVSIRPEFVRLTPLTGKGWSGRVKNVTFFGGLNRYVIEAEGGIEIVAEVSTVEYSTGFRVDEDVSVFLEEASILIFDYPEEGLQKELSLE